MSLQVSIISAVLKIVQDVPKNGPTCFCQNFIKSQPNLIIFGTDSQGDRDVYSVLIVHFT